MARCNAKVLSISITTFVSCANQNTQIRSNGELCICVVPPNHQKQFQRSCTQRQVNNCAPFHYPGGEPKEPNHSGVVLSGFVFSLRSSCCQTFNLH